MSKEMHGYIPLSVVRRTEEELTENLASDKGWMWLHALSRFLRREDPWEVPRLEVTTDGRTGQQCIGRLEKAGQQVNGDLCKVLLHKEFVVTEGVCYKLVVLKATDFDSEARKVRRIREEAALRGYVAPPMEVASYLLDLSFKKVQEMVRGSSVLMVMHGTIPTVEGNCPTLTIVYQSTEDPKLVAYRGSFSDKHDNSFGYVFLDPVED